MGTNQSNHFPHIPEKVTWSLNTIINGKSQTLLSDFFEVRGGCTQAKLLLASTLSPKTLTNHWTIITWLTSTRVHWWFSTTWQEGPAGDKKLNFFLRIWNKKRSVYSNGKRFCFFPPACPSRLEFPSLSRVALLTSAENSNNCCLAQFTLFLENVFILQYKRF